MERRLIQIAPRRRRLPIISLWVLIAALVIACLLFALSYILLLLGRAGGTSAQSTAVLEIVPAASLTPTQETSVGPYPSTTLTLPPPPAGEITIGGYVQVTGTGGDGLRLRDQPSLSAKVRLVASEAEVFQVDEGPVDKDDYTWWHLVGPFDSSRQGWAVINFLQSVQNP